MDLYPDEVYVFTPKGDVFSFPRGATPLDFAYRVHTDLGHHCAGARVNGKLVPLRTPLQNGDMVEVLTNPTRNPSRDWLTFVTTSRAKSKIRQWLNTQQKQRAMEIGRRLFDKEIREYGLSLQQGHRQPGARRLPTGRGHRPRSTTCTAAIGFGKAELRHRARAACWAPSRVAEPAAAAGQAPPGGVSKILPFASAAGPITVKGHGDLLAFLAKCCNPLPGEEIVGYVTRGRGVSVHRSTARTSRTCSTTPSARSRSSGSSRRTTVYRVSLLIEIEDQQGMLARLTEVITRADSNITPIEADTSRETGPARISVVCQLRDQQAPRQAAQPGARDIRGPARRPHDEQRQRRRSAGVASAPPLPPIRRRVPTGSTASCGGPRNPADTG